MKPSLAKSIFSWVKVLLTAFILAVLLREFVIVNASVISGSMEETIMTGDRVICLRLSYLFGEPRRFDVIAFDFYGEGERQIYVKRIVGLPGERVEIIGGLVYIDDADHPLPDSFTKGNPHGSYGPFLVPEGHFFVLGDNRNASYDSKNWPDPFLSRGDILGRAIFTYFPRVQMIARPGY